MTIATYNVLATKDSSRLVKVLTCCVDHRPKTGTEYRGLIDTGQGLPENYVSEEPFDPGTRLRLYDTHWSTVEGHGDVLRLNKTEPL